MMNWTARLHPRVAMGITCLAALALAAPAFGDHHEEKKADETKPKAKAQVGETAPDFELTGIDGEAHKLSDHRGKIVVLHFQNKDCPWDRGYQDQLNALAEKFAQTEGPDGETVVVQFIGVNPTPGETADALQSYHEEREIPYPILLDSEGEVAISYSARTTPHMYVIDEEGVLRYMGGVEKAPVSRSDVSNMDEQYLEPVLAAITSGEELPFEKTVSKGCAIRR